MPTALSSATCTSSDKASAPILDTWSNWRVVGSPSVLEYKGMSQLPGGWWEVLDPNDQWIPGDHYLLQWHSAPNGLVEMTLELDDGQKVTLKQGDCVVQNATRHRWRNPLPEPCLMAFISVGGKRA
jgi:hypothetical protein